MENDSQIQPFRAKIESAHEEPVPFSFLEEFILKPVLIGQGHPLIGRTIRDSKIRETVNGMVVGLERENTRILNPDPETVLQEGDLLKVVGEKSKLNGAELL